MSLNAMGRDNKEFPTYDKAWKSIIALEQKGQYASALEEVRSLSDRANEEKNHPQKIKCYIFQSKYSSYLKEDGWIEILNGLNDDAQSAAQPESSVFYSIAAKFLNQYQQNNQWKIKEMVSLKSGKEDVRLWSSLDFEERISKYYLQSIAWDGLKDIKRKDYEAIIHTGSWSDNLRSSLYDILLHEALEYAHSTLTAQGSFSTSQDYFSNTDDFIRYEFTDMEDGFQKNMLKKLQQRISIFNKEGEIDELVDLELYRVNFALSHSGGSDRHNAWYVNNLESLLKKHHSQSAMSHISWVLAKHYMSQSGRTKDLEETAGLIAQAKSTADRGAQKHPETYGGKKCRELIDQQILSKVLSFTAESVYLPKENIKALITYKNVDKAYVRVAKMPIGGSFDINKWNRNRIDHLKKYETVQRFEIDLPKSSDHVTHNAEFKLDPLPYGEYMLIISNTNEPDNDEYYSYGVIHVSSNSTFLTERESNQTLFVADRKSGLQEGSEKIKLKQ